MSVSASGGREAVPSEPAPEPVPVATSAASQAPSAEGMLLSALSACTASPPDESAPDFAAMRACLEGLDLRALTPELLARWLCTRSPEAPARQAVLEEVLLRGSPSACLQYVEDLQQELCDDMRERLPFDSVLQRAEHDDPAWLAEIQSLLESGGLFGGVGDGRVQMAGFFARAGHARILALLMEGAAGEHGSTPAQATRALAIAAVHLAAGADYLAFCARLLDSPATTADDLMGCHLADILMRPQAASEEGSVTALTLLRRALADPRFAEDAAAQIVSRPGRPAGIPADEWEALLASATLVRANRAAR